MKETIKIRLIFGQKSTKQLLKYLLLYRLIDYVNCNFAKDLKDQKLVIGYCFFLNGDIIFWSSKRQKIVFISTIMAKNILLEHVAKKIVWIKMLEVRSYRRSHVL